MRKFILQMAGLVLLGMLLGLFSGWTTGILAGAAGGLIGLLGGAFLGFSVSDQVAERAVHASERGLFLAGTSATLIGGAVGLVAGAYVGGWLSGIEIMGAMALVGALAGVYAALCR